MPSLNPIWAALFDYTEKVLTLSDTSSYPNGVPQLVKGNFTITQPDGLTRSNQDFTKPDISWNGSALNTFSIVLRLDCKGDIQNGVYTIRYDVQAQGYDNTFLSRTFEFVISDITSDITYDFDVFTPDLVCEDSTNYTQPGFTSSLDRTLTALIQSNGVLLSTTGQTLDLVYGGNYIDSEYTFTLNTTVTYTGNPYTWLSAKINVYQQITAAADTPPTCKTMINQLNTYQDNVNQCGCVASLNKAISLLNSINTSLAAKDYSEALYYQILTFEDIVMYGGYSYENTGEPIPAYNYDCGCSGSGGGGTILSVPISFTVGDPGYDLNGKSSATFTALATGSGSAKTIVIFTKGGLPVNPNTGYTFVPASGTINLLLGNKFATGEQVYIFAIYNG
ncbi:MAG: hypothetical protein ACREHG_06565, partial [Candidatus Saccharimonadales bacterium]